jgi:hypothetical protein
MLGRLGAFYSTDSLALLNQPAHSPELDRFARLPQVVLLLIATIVRHWYHKLWRGGEPLRGSLPLDH